MWGEREVGSVGREAGAEEGRYGGRQVGRERGRWEFLPAP